MLLPYLEKGRIECGVDEAGRGCLAGPVFAAAVILPEDFQNELLNDSKQLTEKQRYELRPIIEAQAIAYAVGIVFPDEIGDFCRIQDNKKMQHNFYTELHLIKKKIFLTKNLQHFLKVRNKIAEKFGVKPQKSSELH